MDYEHNVKFQSDEWFVIHACKDPYHRNALGYKRKGAPKDHPEYLIAERDHRLILNLVDAQNPEYIPYEIIDRAIEYIHEKLENNSKVLVHCNLGESRSPSIGLLYLVKYTDEISMDSFESALVDFIQKYPHYKPSRGIRGFMVSHWDSFVRS